MHGPGDAFATALTKALDRWNLPIMPQQLNQLRAHFEAVVRTNRVMNLTRITDPAEAAVKHYADSLAPLIWVEQRQITVKTVLDVGTGAGFPALPLAVMRPDWSVTAIDATGKKIDFLRRTAAAIGIDNLRCEHAHSQHWRFSSFILHPSSLSRQRSDPGFSLVVFRALTALAKSLEQTARHVTPGGWLVAYKTASVDQDEQDAADLTAARLHLRLDERYCYDLEFENEKLNRILYVYGKPPTANTASHVPGD